MPTWIKIGRRCWLATSQKSAMVLSGLGRDGRVTIRVEGEKRLRHVKPHELVGRCPGILYTREELEAAKAWRIKPAQVRSIRREGKS